MILRVHHAQVSIPIGSEVQAREFYCGFLGLHEIEKPSAMAEKMGGFWAKLGPIEIHFGAEDGIDRKATRSHLAYEVDDVQAWRCRLNERGVAHKTGTVISGYDRLEIRDPFGNRIELIQKL